MRTQTPKIDKTGVNSKKKRPPRMCYRYLYIQRVEKGKYGGQKESLGAKRAQFSR